MLESLKWGKNKHVFYCSLCILNFWTLLHLQIFWPFWSKLSDLHTLNLFIKDRVRGLSLYLQLHFAGGTDTACFALNRYATQTLTAGTCGAVAHESEMCARNKSSAEMTDSCYSSGSRYCDVNAGTSTRGWAKLQLYEKEQDVFSIQMPIIFQHWMEFLASYLSTFWQQQSCRLRACRSQRQRPPPPSQKLRGREFSLAKEEGIW